MRASRAEYRSAKGIARWWAKDGAWHIALPAPDPDPVTGLSNGGFLYTDDNFDSRESAIAAINTR